MTRFSCADSRRQVIRLFSRSAKRTPMGSGTPKAGSQTPLAQGSRRVPEMPGTNRKTASFNTPTDPEKMGLAPVVAQRSRVPVPLFAKSRSRKPLERTWRRSEAPGPTIPHHDRLQPILPSMFFALTAQISKLHQKFWSHPMMRMRSIGIIRNSFEGTISHRKRA